MLLLSTSVWLGGYVAIALVARTAAKTLEPAQRVAFFRGLGRTYLWVGTGALVVALVSGALLARSHAWDAAMVVTLVVAVLLVGSLAVAVRQARQLTRLRRRALTEADAGLQQRIGRSQRAAGWLRALLGLLSVILVVMGAVLAS